MGEAECRAATQNPNTPYSLFCPDDWHADLPPSTCSLDAVLLTKDAFIKAIEEAKDKQFWTKVSGGRCLTQPPRSGAAVRAISAQTQLTTQNQPHPPLATPPPAL